MKGSRENLNKLIISTVTITLISTLAPVTNVWAKKLDRVDEFILEGNTKNTLNENKLIKELRLKWKDDLVGGKNVNISNSAIISKSENIEKQTDKALSTINMDKSKNYLWYELRDFKKDPSKITAMYGKVFSMSMAYNLSNNKYYKDAILKEKIKYALDWLYCNAYNENIKEYGNWWHWMIGTPANLNNIVILMYNDLPHDKIITYMNAIQKFSPSIEPGSKHHTGANLTDVCINKILQGVILKNKDMIEEGSKDVVSVFDYVTNGVGFYKDGSFVQHDVVAYTGSYGNVLINKVSSIMYLLEGTPWEVKTLNKNNVYKWIFESFDPIIYKGYTMDMVRGRSIARHNSSGYEQTVGIIQGMIKLSMIAPKEMSNKIKALVKEWGEEAKSVIDYGCKFDSINVINEYYKIMNDNSIKAKNQEANDFNLNMMDKTVHERNGYCFAISKGSNRISKYEFMNKENLKPWFQGDGMTYLYNDDLTQFSKDFWPTIDPYRLPGTTINKMPRKNKSGCGPAITFEMSLSPWSGGTNIGSYGISGMEIRNKNDDLKANKSWFMFDDEIVALGSGITSDDTNNIETIIENRKIVENGKCTFTVDGNVKVENLGDKDKVKNAKWAYLQGKTKNENIGYYFPNGENINLIKELRKGNWKEIDPPKGDKKAENSYLTMYINHGKVIKNDTYSYVLLPGKSEKEIKEYTKNPHIKILRNDEFAQGVLQTSLNIEGANFWTDGKNTSGSITSSGKASIMVKENTNGTLTISVSDATFEQHNLNIEINKPASSVIESDNNISNIDLSNNKIKFKVHTKNAKGKSFKLTVNK
ncbi:polysaccharide lyase 8 family protein [Clostridium tarantellae]|uniref:Silent information regulator protein Sir2 n=1 Tax=Clostridium tarantellae TaxID=39493 RepID=A0A6I1MP32_9CLOT|nr:polysaccharide lyase 8 family protein [Clostridium tarantellae]MPQ44824.1 silent information regulator protein Sir2 [Clostridium tarantellae]